VDARVIAATNQNLRQAIIDKRFREDLFYRLSMVEIRMPALAEHKEDLALLERYFVTRFSREFRKPIRGLTQRARLLLARHSWPGNVRELENAIGHGCMMTLSDTIDVADLPEYLHGLQPPAADAGVTTERVEADSLESHERRLIQEALEKAGGNQSQAARLLRIGRDALRYKMKKYQMLTS
jgi:transcriptional regulator with PAS, ATPase and Fis domain